MLRFEWDEPKATQNIAKHGLQFEYAARVSASAEADRKQTG